MANSERMHVGVRGLTPTYGLVIFQEAGQPMVEATYKDSLQVQVEGGRREGIQ